MSDDPEVGDAAVDELLRVLAPLLESTRRVSDFPAHIAKAHRDYMGDFTSRAAMVDRLFAKDAIAAAIAANTTETT